MLDLSVHGGMVFDGRGGEAVRADIGIEGDRIAAVGDLSLAEARFCVDASGRNVCPGFVDVHSHSDAYLLIEPSAPSKIHQGVTTEVVGNCGASAAPRTERNRMPSDWLEHKYPGTWQSFAEYRTLLEKVKPAVNAVLLVGHNTLRGGVLGYENRAATADERRQMLALLQKSLDEGARGMSTGLIYSPGMFTPPEEIVELARAVAARHGTYATHMRNEGPKLIEAIDEALALGRESGVSVQISHLKTSGEGNWHLIDAALDRLRKARAGGVAVAADRYPYMAGNTDLDVVFPAWAAEGGRDVIMARLRDPGQRQKLVRDMRDSRPDDAWKGVVIGSVAAKQYARFRGQPLVAVAKELGMHPVEAIVTLVEADNLKTMAFFFGMSEENMKRIFAEPYVMVGSDASIRCPTGPLSKDYPHPRAYGTFPRFLRMSLEGETVPLPEAVRKMTALPAEKFGLRDRGRLEKGMKADIVVFDPDKVRDTATYADPHQFAAGIDHVIVNGIVTLKDGKLTGQRGGRVL